jgi:hypothetical protein
MPKWKKLVLGDHPFTLKSRDPNFYRDMALVLPLFVFIFGAFAYLPTPGPGRKLGYEFLAAALLTLVAAKEKLFVLAALALWTGVCFVNPWFPVWKNWRQVIGAAICFLAAWLITKVPGFKPSYGIPDEFGFWELMTLLAPLTGSLAFVWLVIKHQPLP